MHLIFNLPRFAKIGLLVSITALAALFFFFDPSGNEYFPKCLFHSLTGYYCPGCGSQRAIHSLLHFDFAGVAGNNFLFLPGLAVAAYGIFLPLVNKRFGKNYKNWLYHRRAPWVIFIVIFLFWILRNLPVYPFSLLAPG